MVLVDDLMNNNRSPSISTPSTHVIGHCTCVLQIPPPPFHLPTLTRRLATWQKVTSPISMDFTVQQHTVPVTCLLTKRLVTRQTVTSLSSRDVSTYGSSDMTPDQKAGSQSDGGVTEQPGRLNLRFQ